MPTRDENDSKNAKCMGDFHPKTANKKQGQGSNRKTSKKPRWAKFRGNEKTAQTEKLSIFAGSKIKQVKESGS